MPKSGCNVFCLSDNFKDFKLLIKKRRFKKVNRVCGEGGETLDSFDRIVHGTPIFSNGDGKKKASKKIKNHLKLQ